MSSKRKTKYNKAWESEFSWIQPCKTDVFSAQCKICLKTFAVSGGGISQVSSHKKSKLHITREKESNGQCLFRKDNDNTLRLKNTQITLSNDELVRKAEIIQALKCVDSNQSFSSTNDDGKKFQEMFPDSEIAKQYRQGETKTKYTIQYGIYPYLKDLLLDDIKNVAFTFKFDESTTQQVNKQYDGYIQYWSKRFKCIKISYCGTIMVDHCPAEKLLDHFLEFVDKVKLQLQLMLHLGMDGPNVNLKFEKLLNMSSEMKNLNTSILSIGTCPLHIVHNAFRAGVNKLNFGIDSFAIDVNFFFKLSTARRADYREMVEFTEVISRFIQKHSSTRWVTLRKICVQILEQYENLRRYFLTFLPKTSTFKSAVKETERYKRIKTVLEGETSIPYIAFIAFIANDFEIFLTMFQSMKPKIHIVFSEMTKLLRALMAKFVKSKLLFVNNNGVKEPRSINELLTINVNDQKNWKPLKLIDIGTKAKSCFIESFEVSPVEKKFRQNCLEAFQALITHLKSKLPWESSILKNCAYLDPRKKCDKESLRGISNLAIELSKPLEGALSKVFPSCVTKEDVCDKVRNEWRVYQMEVLPESAYLTDSTVKSSSRQQVSYWQKAFQLADLPVISEAKSGLDIDNLIVYLESSIQDDDGSPKFPLLASLFKVTASLSHGNSAPENGFSINKYLLQLHGNAISPDTIEALRFVKDTILSFGGILNIPITKSLLESSKLAYSRYNADLEAKRQLEKKEEEARKRMEAELQNKKETENERNTLVASIQQVSLNFFEIFELLSSLL